MCASFCCGLKPLSKEAHAAKKTTTRAREKIARRRRRQCRVQLLVTANGRNETHVRFVAPTPSVVFCTVSRGCPARVTLGASGVFANHMREASRQFKRARHISCRKRAPTTCAIISCRCGRACDFVCPANGKCRFSCGFDLGAFWL